jgi:hypothetical protein
MEVVDPYIEVHWVIEGYENIDHDARLREWTQDLID